MKFVQNDEELRKDCFAYNKEKSRCNALKEFVCAYENCKFYKHRGSVDIKEIEKAIKSYDCSEK